MDPTDGFDRTHGDHSLFASGAIMSLDKGNFKLLQWSHRIAPIVLIGLGVWMVVVAS